MRVNSNPLGFSITQHTHRPLSKKRSKFAVLNFCLYSLRKEGRSITGCDSSCKAVTGRMNKKFPAQFHFARLPVRCWNPAIIGDRSCILQFFPGFYAKKTDFRQTNSSPVSLFGKFSHLLWPLCGISTTQPSPWTVDTEKPQAMNRSDIKPNPGFRPLSPPHATPPMSPGNCFAIRLSILGSAS